MIKWIPSNSIKKLLAPFLHKKKIFFIIDIYAWKKNVKYSFQYCFIIIIPDDQVFVSDMFEYTDVVCDKFSTVL